MNLDGGAFNLGLERAYGKTDRQQTQWQEVDLSLGSEQGKYWQDNDAEGEKDT